MADEDHIRELLKREIEWLDRHTREKMQDLDRLMQTELRGIDRHAQTQINDIEKATGVAMNTLNERLKGWPEKMDTIEKKVAGFEGRALIFGGIAGFVMSVLAGVIILRVLT